MKCLGKDRHNNCCRNKQIDSTFFCKFHQYMCEYTTDMLEKLELCKGCKKMYYFTDDSIKTCENCRTRDKSCYKKPVVLCKKEGCSSKKSDENDYCGKHQIHIFIDETVNNGKKLCFNYVRGCKTQLELDYTFSKCQLCLEKDRLKDQTKRNNVKELNKTIETNIKYCTTCCKEYDMAEFVGDNPNTETKTCSFCRYQNKEQDKHRDKEKRNLLAKLNINQTFSSYVKEAKRRSIEFQLSKHIFCDIVRKNCHYCGEINDEKKFNGIDRMDSAVGYLLENCVSCCSLCNYLKNKYSVDTFIKRIQHIVCYINENKCIYEYCFPNFISGNYKQYIKSAKVRNIPFLLDEETFHSMTEKECYICGKKNSLTHRNGIDRYDNSLGYIESNCKSCCNTCNIMKNRFSYDEIISKFKKIISYMS